MKQSITSSKICKDLKGENLNWRECTEYAESSLVIKACELWESGSYKNTEEIANQLKLARTTVINMLNRGNKYGWCVYNGEHVRNKTLRTNVAKMKRRIIQYDLQGNIINTYNSVTEAMQKTGCHMTNIIETARKHQNTAGGFIWRYTDDTDPLVPIINRNHKKVIQYSFDGEKIQEYVSVVSAAEQTGISKDKIAGCARGKSPKQAGGYIWRYENIPFSIEEKVNPRCKKVTQYDLKGNRIKEFSSVAEASKVTGIWKSNIALAARKQKNTAGGYIWRYVEEVESHAHV